MDRVAVKTLLAVTGSQFARDMKLQQVQLKNKMEGSGTKQNCPYQKTGNVGSNPYRHLLLIVLTYGPLSQLVEESGSHLFQSRFESEVDHHKHYTNSTNIVKFCYRTK